MTRTLALIHTSPVLVPTFTALTKAALGATRVYHIVDESLIQNTIRAGRLEKTTIRRLVHQVESASQAGADAVLVTCSSIGPAVDVARQLFDFPVLRIDEAMAESAVQTGERVGVIATLSTTLEPTVALIEATARRLGRACRVTQHLCEGAFQAVLAGDTATHDRAVTEGLHTLAASVDVIVLAQASMARVAAALPSEAGLPPILSSPALAIEKARQTLESLA